MRPVLLRCLDIGTYTLPDGQLLDAAGLVAMHEKLSISSRNMNGHRDNSTDYTLTIPAQKCLLTSVPVAKHEAALLRKTLPWVLEERLLEPAETQHFALGKIMGNTAAVCVVNSSWFAAVLA